jgi:hypothetical protein
VEIFVQKGGKRIFLNMGVKAGVFASLEKWFGSWKK